MKDPKLEIIRFQDEDVIATSGDPNELPTGGDFDFSNSDSSDPIYPPTPTYP